MRQNQQNKQRMRGRNRKGPNPLTRSYESNGPDVKIRGTALHVAEKYTQLARDASSSGDRVMAENYLQHAEHYYRIIAAAQAALQPQYGRDDVMDGDDDDVEVPGSDRFEPRQIEFRNPQEGRGNGDYQQPREGGYQQREGQQPREGRDGGYQQRGEGEGYQPREGREQREGGYQQRGNRNDRGDREGFQGRNRDRDFQSRNDRNDRGGDRPEREGFQPRGEGAPAPAGEQRAEGEARPEREGRRNRRERFERFDRRGDRPAQQGEPRAEAPVAAGGHPMPLDAPQPDVNFPDFITKPAIPPAAVAPAPAPVAAEPAPAPARTRAPAPAPAPVAEPVVEAAAAAEPVGEDGEKRPTRRRAPARPRTRRTAEAADAAETPEPAAGE
ncbi:DUF4167 domain-containing protein [Oharaeibacter diazotrophicus]|uniref:Uncharacterized protein DUF4167 n=2 Tax=Oharaeibacter diazotrophicus TaxID=1920512 RepID=A0A4R6R503_9HYPH|nr:DUF4167 domain-containing protein [Oharaeibacter diazotrophicus]TDP80950.1 uncharacterized protein DUF4167 [Oharaeibacter diazotrophicus]BBE73844.1 hypothetical protein OHA_1_03461 [Pleomorphomonas sp. SM30]GLS74671.1 hypothetical protein GCM10007904_00060 [Oharaeibacter diazotrophicus]